CAVWKVVVLIELAPALGIGAGYLCSGRHVARLDRELAGPRTAATGPRDFHGEGVVRAVLPELGVVVITLDQIAGYMPAMTMGFRATSPKVYDAVETGDAVRFTLSGVHPNLAIRAIEKLGRR